MGRFLWKRSGPPCQHDRIYKKESGYGDEAGYADSVGIGFRWL